jgi:hypothetical protein
MTSRFVVAAVLLLPLACADPPADKAEQQGDAKQAQAEPTEKEATPTAAPAPANPNELTADEIALIEADPKTLTPEQNRKRAFALRKKVMQDPDSPAAQALEEAREAALAGQVDGSKPEDNGVVIPTPDYLKDQSYGKPAE